MNRVGDIAVIGMVFGMAGTTLGGVFGAFVNIKSKKIIDSILKVTAILMLIIVFTDLIPESLRFSNLRVTICGALSGIFVMLFCNEIVSEKIPTLNKHNKSLLKAGIVIGIGLAIHNFPEGLAIGSGFEASTKLGVSLAIAICLHDFPEGIAMAVPLKQGGYDKLKVILYTAISGVSTGIGALAGALIGDVSKQAIGLSLGFAAGAMIYIASILIFHNTYRWRFRLFQ